ncbi:MAG: geranylgeranylglyceryl/heptaprenylglyceryl phosphate synthase [Gemmatimonadetes bacterium]|nr:MAG: geranylgeranylglyceryl/heptaprenylglyceryl phosphate synthase [Gemmatimonadota bacterium]
MTLVKCHSYLLERIKHHSASRGGAFLPLIDPDKQDYATTIRIACHCQDAGADAILIGGSLLFSNDLDTLIQNIKEEVSIPLILFPGSSMHLSPYADAIFYLSLISGRNANLLIGEHVISAPIIHKYQLEAIPTGYMLIESGRVTSVEFVSNTRPIPRNKTSIAVAHALAAEYLGMKLIYLEGGSGALQSVPVEMIRAIREVVQTPLIVGGGIRTPEEAAAKVEAGANIVVVGTAIEQQDDPTFVRTMAAAVHQSG